VVGARSATANARRNIRALAGRSHLYRRGMVAGTVRFWLSDEGWGVVDSVETPGGCFAHFSVVRMDGYKQLAAARAVELEWEVPAGGEYEGWPFFATEVTPV
jgi:CspA family cold shock protein